ncbi:MAG: hypothetical protein ACLFUU_11280 [Desulfobacteraceae bacterium]
MSYSRIIVIASGLLLALAFPFQGDLTKGKPVQLLQPWRGSVDDLLLMQAATEFILSAHIIGKSF